MGRLRVLIALLLFAPAIIAQGPSKTQNVNGGTGQDSSGWTGCAHVVSGVWSSIPCATVIGTSDVTARTTSQTTTNLVTSTPSTTKYRINYYVNENALCSSGSVSVFLVFSWYDPVAQRTIQSLSLTIGITQSAPFGSVQGSFPIYAQASTAIIYTSTVTGSCTTGGPASYDAHIAVEEIQ